MSTATKKVRNKIKQKAKQRKKSIVSNYFDDLDKDE